MPPDKAPQRRNDGTFLPGHGGRKAGAKNKATTLIKAKIEAAFEEDAASGDGTKLDAAIKAQVDNATAGDLMALNFLLQYWIGRPRQAEPDDTGNALSALAQLSEILRGSESDFRPNADMIGHAEETDDDN